MKLTKMIFENFKSFEEAVIPFDDITAIRGANATGKSTIYDGYLWCLTGKDQFDRSNFEVKPNNKEMKGKKTSIEVVFENPTINFKRMYEEKWVKSKGSLESEFSGHTTTLFVNGLEVKQKDFDIELSKIVESDLFKVLSNPLYLHQKNWQDRRKIILNLAENFNDTSNDIKLCEQEIRKISKELSEKEIIINELTKQLETVEETYEELQKLQMDRYKNNLNLFENTKITDVKSKLQKLEVDFSEQKRKYQDEYDENIKTTNNKIKLLEEEFNTAYSSLLNLKNTLQRKTLEKDDLLDRYKKEYAKNFEAKNTCPTCNRDFPIEQIEQLKETFNINKSNLLIEIKNKGTQLKLEVEKLQNDVKNMELQPTKIKSEIEKLQNSKKDIINVAETLKLSDMETYTELQQKLFDLQKSSSSELQEEEKNEIQQKLFKLSNNEKIQMRIKEVKAEVKECSTKHIEYTAKLQELTHQKRENIKSLEENINSKFKFAKWKLFDIQVNGDIVECCDATYKDIIYPSLNTASKINIGIDIINTLSKHYNINLPVFIDNRESIIKLIPSESQIISLIVDEKCHELKFE